MSFLRRLFGGSPTESVAADPARADSAPIAREDGDTASVRRIVTQLEAMPADQARFVAAAAYVLARVANADFDMSPEETAYMEKSLVEGSRISEAQAVLVVESAKQQARLFGSTEDFLVTREFRAISTPEERLRLLRGCFLAAAADNTITSDESATLNQIANELEIEAADLSALRSEFGDRLSVVQAMRARQGR